MNELVFKSEKGNPITTSLLVAEKFGKEHKNVIRDIQNLSAQNSALTDNQAINKMFALTYYESPLNNGTGAVGKYPMYVMNRDGFSLLVMGFTGSKALQFKLDFIEAFNKMEKTIKQSALTPKTPNEMFMMQAHINIETEKRIERIEEDTEELKKGLAEIKQVQEQARFNMDYTPLSSEQVPEMSQRMAINYLVSLYQRKYQVGYDEIWNHIYSQLYFRHKVAIRKCKREKGETLLDVAERKGHLDKIHGIISNLLNS